MKANHKVPAIRIASVKCFPCKGSCRVTSVDFVLRWNGKPISRTHCFYCGQPFKSSGTRRTKTSRTSDHVWPRSLGYSGMNKRNTVGACYKCNLKKGSSTPLEFRELHGTFFAEKRLHLGFPSRPPSLGMILESMVDSSYMRMRNTLNQIYSKPLVLR